MKYCRAAIPTKKMSLHGNNLGSSMENQNDFSSRSMSSSSDDMQSLRNCPSTTETIPLPKPRVPPPIPQNAPIASSLPSPLYTSPVYRPDIDLSLPLNCVPERNQVTKIYFSLLPGDKSLVGVNYRMPEPLKCFVAIAQVKGLPTLLYHLFLRHLNQNELQLLSIWSCNQLLSKFHLLASLQLQWIIKLVDIRNSK